MSGNLRISAEEYMPLRDVVFHSLREAIIKGDLKPGERLLEIQLAEKLGVSRTPIREAIRKLELEGLVTMLPRRGATVAGITKKHLQEVLEVRKALEVLTIELACERMNSDAIGELQDVEREFRSKINTDDAMDLADVDERFHTIINVSTRNGRLISILANLREQIYRYRLECLRDKTSREQLLEDHEEIIEALKSHNKEKAIAVTRRHIEGQEEMILRKLD